MFWSTRYSRCFCVSALPCLTLMSSLKTIILKYLLVCVFLVSPCCVHRDRRPDPTVSVVPSPRFVLFVFSSGYFVPVFCPSLAASPHARRSWEFMPPFAALPSRGSREFTPPFAAQRSRRLREFTPPFAAQRDRRSREFTPPFAAQPSRRSREFTPLFAAQPARRSQETTSRRPRLTLTHWPNPKRLTLHSSYSLSALAFPGNRTHDLGVASAMLYHLSYRKATGKHMTMPGKN